MPCLECGEREQSSALTTTGISTVSPTTTKLPGCVVASQTSRLISPPCARGARSVPGIRFTPEKLNWFIGETTILDRLRRGNNIIRIQLAFAAHRGIEHTVDTRPIRFLELKTGKAIEIPDHAYLSPLA